MTLRSTVEMIIQGDASCPLRQARRRLRLNPPRQPNNHRPALHPAAFVAICAVRREQFRKFSDRIGQVIRPVSAAIHSSVVSIAVGEPQHAAP